jgi:hypothetical protein
MERKKKWEEKKIKIKTDRREKYLEKDEKIK